jgi:hypothetical protein
MTVLASAVRSPAPSDARLAGTLFAHALAALRVLPAEERGPALGAIDRFLAAPGPAGFIAAVRLLGEARRRRQVAAAAGSTLERAFADGLAALRAVPGLPAVVGERLADLPVDTRAGQRLHALAALARAYEELGARVAADTDEMRRRLRESAPRKSHPRR